MDSFAPEFSRFWLLPGDEERVEPARLEDEAAQRQRQALEELAERVTAARTIV